MGALLRKTESRLRRAEYMAEEPTVVLATFCGGAARWVDGALGFGHFPRMSTLAEIEAAADSLPSEEKEELLRFLAMRLRKERTTPKPRIYSEAEIAAMLAEDEADGARFREGK